MFEVSAESSTFWLSEVAELSSSASTFWLSLVFEVSADSSTFWLTLELEVPADVPLEVTEFSTFWLLLELEVSTEDSASTFLASEVTAEVTEVSTSSTPSGVVTEESADWLADSASTGVSPQCSTC